MKLIILFLAGWRGEADGKQGEVRHGSNLHYVCEEDGEGGNAEVCKDR